MEEEPALASCRRKLILFLRFSDKCCFIRLGFFWEEGRWEERIVTQPSDTG